MMHTSSGNDKNDGSDSQTHSPPQQDNARKENSVVVHVKCISSQRTKEAKEVWTSAANKAEDT